MRASADRQLRAVPPRALGVSALALAVAVAAAAFFPDTMEYAGRLLWLLALIPAFLLAYYRGWRHISVALGAGMVVITGFNSYAVMAGREVEDWPVFLFVVGVYITLALGGGWLTEIRWRIEELERTEAELRRAYNELHQAHENLKATQLQLIQAAKLDSVGRLAAGVAHEVKNPLMTLLWGVRYLSEHHPAKDENIVQLLEDMADAVQRANTVITDLLDYSALRELDVKPEDLNEVVERSVSLLKHEWDRSRVSVVKELADGLPPLMLDRFKMEQVLVNVLMNSIHAMNGDGTVTIRTFDARSAPAPRDGADRPSPTSVPGERSVLLQIEDTGTGISEDKLEKIFDPFFTTKPPGKGTGLGLSVVRQIVEMHGGRIDIGNREEGGVRVTIALQVPAEEARNGEEANPDR